jgi:hypothetical protein
LVVKYTSGTDWDFLGIASTGGVADTSVSVDPVDNKPVIAFLDVQNGNKAHVMKWSTGQIWTDYGYPGTGSGYYSWWVGTTSAGKVFVVYSDADNAGRVRVKMLD